ncbi:MAG: putative toxin-antitoxin system toxin component, PIN family [Bacteroidales bacterium]|nr:putative toxin-antitoxin system toxin component, PIN family [Bacteroidales bacterium]
MSTVYAVFDTNVLVSALMSKRDDSPTVLLLNHVLDGRIVLVYNEEIVSEYQEVLHRDKFGFSDERIKTVLEVVRTGLCLGRTPSNEIFPDQDDAVFYEVALSKEGTFLITGNLRHFPKSPIVVTPAEMISILEAK